MSDVKTWWVQYDDGIAYQKGIKPKAVEAVVEKGKLQSCPLPSNIVSASISLPLYGKTQQDEAIGSSYSARKSALELIAQIKKHAKFEGDVDIKVDSWREKGTGIERSALKYVAYAKKKE